MGSVFVCSRNMDALNWMSWSVLMNFAKGIAHLQIRAIDTPGRWQLSSPPKKSLDSKAHLKHNCYSSGIGIPLRKPDVTHLWILIMDMESFRAIAFTVSTSCLCEGFSQNTLCPRVFLSSFFLYLELSLATIASLSDI